MRLRTNWIFVNSHTHFPSYFRVYAFRSCSKSTIVVSFYTFFPSIFQLGVHSFFSFSRAHTKCLLANSCVCKCVQNAHQLTSMGVLCIYDVLCTNHFFFFPFHPQDDDNGIKWTQMKVLWILRWWTEWGSVEWASEKESSFSKIDRERKFVWLMIAPICNKINYTLNVMILSRIQSSLNIPVLLIHRVHATRWVTD